MIDSSSSSDDLKRTACQMAWKELARDNPQGAAEALHHLAEESAKDELIAEVWVAMLGWVDDLDHLEREIRRIASRMAKVSKVVSQISLTIHKAWSRQSGSLPPAPRESLIGLGVDLLDFCIESAPPPKPKDRAELYLRRAQLLCWAGPLADERALLDYEVALSLVEDHSEGWFMLARLHLQRGRWEKAALAAIESKKRGFDELRVGWMLSIALTALAPLQVHMAPSLEECWALAGHKKFIEEGGLDPQGRWVAPGIERQWIMISSGLVREGGGWELTEEWLTELVLVQPLSPCHGRILNPTQESLPADFDDVIIWDPHPIDFISISGGEEVAVMKGLGILNKGAVFTRPLPRPRLSDEQMSQLNAVLTNGVFYYQAAEELCPDQQLGKLCWPRKAIAKEVIDQFRAQWDRLNLPGSTLS